MRRSYSGVGRRLPADGRRHTHQQARLRCSGSAGCSPARQRPGRGRSPTPRARARPGSLGRGLVRPRARADRGPVLRRRPEVRRNITEGKAGVPLTLRLTVVDASTCRPLRVRRLTSGTATPLASTRRVQGNTRTFLRGIQRTDAKGSPCSRRSTRAGVPGRTVHVHVQVSLGGTSCTRAALLPRLGDGRRLPAHALQPPTEPGSTERRRQHLPERRQALDLRLARRGWLRRLDHDGRRARLEGHPLPPRRGAFT